jgi:hypothetical protein
MMMRMFKKVAEEAPVAKAEEAPKGKTEKNGVQDIGA